MSALSSLFVLAEAERIPLKATVELLAPCNLKCPHCYVTHSRKNRLTQKVLADLFAQMQDAGGLYLTLTGGEVGLRKDLFEIIEEAKRRHFEVKLLSSGTLWGSREWDRLSALGVGSVRLSVYATRAHVHDKVTLTPGSHAKTMATALGLLERGVKVEFASPIMNTNVDDVPEVMALAERLGVGIGFDAKITMTDSSGTRPKDTVAPPESLVRFYNHPRVRPQLETIDACAPSNDARPCGVGDISAFVRSSGDVLPCSNWPESAGNVLETPYLTIFRDSPIFNYCRSLRRRDLTTCSSCGDRGVCSPCAAMNLRETQSVATPSHTVCDATAARAVALTGVSRQTHRTPRLRIVG